MWAGRNFTEKITLINELSWGGKQQSSTFTKKMKITENFYLQFKNEKSVTITMTFFFYSGSSICIYCLRGTTYAQGDQFLLRDGIYIYTESILNDGSSQSLLTISPIVQSHRIQIINNNLISISNCYHTKYAENLRSIILYQCFLWNQLCLRSSWSLWQLWWEGLVLFFSFRF